MNKTTNKYTHVLLGALLCCGPLAQTNCMQPQTLSEKEQKGPKWVQDDQQKTTPCLGNTQSFASDFMKKNWPKGKDSTANTVEHDLANLHPLILTEPGIFRLLEEKNSIYQQANANLVHALLSQQAHKNVATPERWHVKIANEQLFDAIINNSLEDVQAALDAGAQTDGRNECGDTPLTLAICQGNLEIAKLLLENGANPNLPDKDGWTPLTLAICQGNLEIAKLLLQNKANPNTPGRNGDTPLRCACRLDSPEIAKLLLSRQATPPTFMSPLWDQVIQRLLQLVAHWTNRQGNNPATQQEFDHFTQHPQEFLVLLFNNNLLAKVMNALTEQQRNRVIETFFEQMSGPERQTYLYQDIEQVANDLRRWTTRTIWDDGMNKLDRGFRENLGTSLTQNLDFCDIKCDTQDTIKWN